MTGGGGACWGAEETTMLAPIATLVFAAAMALSLSVEADSFFHEPSTTTPDDDDDSLPPGGTASTPRDAGSGAP